MNGRPRIRSCSNAGEAGDLVRLQEAPLRLVQLGMLALDETWAVASLDRQARALLGQGSAGFPGQPLLRCLPPQGATDALGPSSVPVTYLGRTGDQQCLVNVTRAPGSKEGFVATLVFVDGYLAASQALAQVQLRNIVEAVIAGFAHEVRNPLAAILSLTEAALQQNPSPDSVLVRIPSLVDRIESLLRQSLAYSRPKPPNRRLHPPSFLIDHALALLRPRETFVQLSCEEAPGVPAVLVDQNQVEQILVNLLENALDVAEHQVRVRVTPGSAHAGSAVIEISDDGPGVPEDVAPRIFDPFFTTKAHGTGLGLAIARDLARLNGGDLQLASTGPGATFRVFLPATAERASRLPGD